MSYQFWTCIAFACAWGIAGNFAASSSFVAASLVIGAIQATREDESQ